MVKLLICFLFFTFSLTAEPLIEASVDPKSGQVNQKIKGTIIITHRSEEVIDQQSFKLNQQPFIPTFFQDVVMSAEGKTILSIYTFELPAQPKGLYVLPAITVNINDKTYTSVPSTYEVKELNAPKRVSAKQATSSSQRVYKPATGDILFQLETEVKGPTTLYPGQRIKLIYRILYNRNVDLARTELPFVHPPHFLKVGDVQIEDRQQEETTVQELTQEIEASEIGTFTLGPSIIEGYAYDLNSLNQKVYQSGLLQSEAPAITLDVKAFPSPQPLSFTGGLGQVKLTAQLQSSNQIKVGENLELQVIVQGLSNLTDLRLPSLKCQPGFSGFFQLSDLPPAAELKNDQKIFTIILRPLSSLMQEIPSIFLTSFDPATGQYKTQHTTPIPLNFLDIHLAIPFETSALPFLKQETWLIPPPFALEPINEPPILTSPSFPFTQTAWNLWLFPLTLLGFWLGKRQLVKSQQQPKKVKLKSETLLQAARRSQRLKDLESALWWRLWEKNEVSTGVEDLDQVRSQEFSQILFELQRLQYTPQSKNQFSVLYKQVQQVLTNKPDPQ